MAMEKLSLIGLKGLEKRAPSELSGGQQQRVAVARALVLEPQVLLFDEPLSNLDAKLRRRVREDIRELQQSLNLTVAYVTHDQEEALALSDRICLMNHARIEQLGPPHEIYARPATAFAADFIGISNIFRGRIDAASGGEIHLSTRHGSFRLPSGAARTDKEATLVVRPEQITLGGDKENTVVGRVADTVYAGSETRLIVDLDGGDTVIVRLPPGRPVPVYGERATLGWNPDEAVLVP
jgi:putative spermidine/putrescine transport system ATP-binding protein